MGGSKEQPAECALACCTATQSVVLLKAFHGKIERKVKTMQERKKVAVVNDKPFFGIDIICTAFGCWATT